MGSTHKICQDYALSESRHIFPYIIVSDGCSSSPDTDIGARIISCRARENIFKIMNMLSKDTAEAVYSIFGYEVINESRAIAHNLGLPMSCLDATLLVSVIRNNDIYTFMYGDGVIMSRKRSGVAYFMSRDFQSNAPYYLSYWADNARREMYKKEYGNMSIRLEVYDIEGNPMRITPPEILPYDHKFISVEPLEDYQSITIGSDGVKSLVDITGSKEIGPKDSLSLIEFKNTAGEFLKRRVLKATKDWSKANIQHTDDLGLAGFHIE